MSSTDAVTKLRHQFNELKSRLTTDCEFVNGKTSGKDFVMFESIQTVLTEKEIETMLTLRAEIGGTASLANGSVLVREIMGSTAAESTRTVLESNWEGSLRVFAILLYHPFRHYLRQQLAHWIDGAKENIILDKDLPLEKERVAKLFKEDDQRQFMNSQHLFSAPVLMQGQVNEVEPGRRVPFVGDKIEIGHGNSATVYAVKIATGYWGEGVMRNISELEVAEKVFAEEDDYNDEKLIVEWLKERDTSPKAIVLHLACLRVDGTFSLIFPRAQRSLLEFFSEDKDRWGPGPAYIGDRQALENAENLASALVFLELHDVKHMDIYPRNVLIFENVNGPPIWRLADFDRAQIATRKISRTWQKMDAQDTQSSDQGKGSVSKNEVEGFYLAPEASNKIYNSKSDLWSLAGILIQLYSYMSDMKGDREKLNSFAKQLGDSQKNQQYSPGKLYLRTDLEGSEHMPDPFIEQWLTELADIRDSQTQQEDVLFRRLTKTLWDKILSKIDYKERWSATDLRSHLKDAMLALDQSLASNPQSNEIQATSDAMINSDQLNIEPDVVDHRTEATSVSPSHLQADASPLEPSEISENLAESGQTNERSATIAVSGAEPISNLATSSAKGEPDHTTYCQALHDAVTGCDSMRLERCILENGSADVNQTCPKCNKSPLHWLIFQFARHTNPKHLQDLLETLVGTDGIDLSILNASKNTPWQQCCLHGWVVPAQVLYRLHPEVCSRNDPAFAKANKEFQERFPRR